MEPCKSLVSMFLTEYAFHDPRKHSSCTEEQGNVKSLAIYIYQVSTTRYQSFHSTEDKENMTQ